MIRACLVHVFWKNVLKISFWKHCFGVPWKLSLFFVSMFLKKKRRIGFLFLKTIFCSQRQ